MTSYEEQLNTLHGRVHAFINRDQEFADDKSRKKVPIQIMKELCTLGRNAERNSYEQMDDTLNHIEDLLCQTINFCHNTMLFEQIYSFAHDSVVKHPYPGEDAESDEGEPSDGNYPLIEDSNPKGVISYQLMDDLKHLIAIMGQPSDPAKMPKPPAPWWEISRPHSRSSRLSRFRENVPTLSTTEATPTALNVYQARCEIQTSRMCTPVRIVSHSSPTECIMAIPSLGGFNDSSSILQYVVDAEPIGSATKQTIENTMFVRLAEIAYHGAIDPARKLLFTGDNDRVKSFEWGNPGIDGACHQEAKAVHTFDSSGFDGPMMVLGDGRFMRAGRGKIGVWNLNDLTEETHANYGRRPIGGRKIPLDEFRYDDAADIERSWGTAAGQTISLWLPNLKPNEMAPHPSGTANLVLLGAQFNRENNSDPLAKYSCVVLDVEQGKPVSKILGHGDEVLQFSTSSADPNVFATGCGDGYVRLFDVRTHFPVITFNVTNTEEECGAVALAYPDGIPSLFTGLLRGQHIKFWDIRAKAAVYDLGTGNNAIGSIAWDERRQVLYAAAACEHTRSYGDRSQYRQLRVPQQPQPEQDEEEHKAKQKESKKNRDEDSDDSEDDDDDDDWVDEGSSEGCTWPKRAHHGEDYYPYIFDSGYHRLFRYAFKTDPNIEALPQNEWD